MNTTEKLRELAKDCLASPGDPAMIAPMLKTAAVLAPLDDAEMARVAGGPTIANLGDSQPIAHTNPFVYNE